MPRLFLTLAKALPLLLSFALTITADDDVTDIPLDYGKAIGLSTLFYEAQRSGKLPSTNRIPWRGDSALGDGGDHGLDLSGGWYDAGDHIKFNFPMAWSATTLIWGALEYWDAWKSVKETDLVLDTIKWPLDYLLKCHPDPDTYYVQVGSGDSDHGYWGSAEGMNMWRPSYAIGPNNPGTEFAAEGAAALASGSLLFKDHDAAFANEMKAKAQTLFDLADKHRGTSTISEPFYKSYSGYWDELAWGAIWLYKATGDKKYLDKAENEYYKECCVDTTKKEFSWDRKGPAVQLLLYRITKKDVYKAGFEAFMDSWFNMARTPKGLVFFDQWAPNRYASNTAFLALLAADYGFKDAEKYREFAKSQIDYVLKAGGDVNPESKQPYYSYLIGFGDNYPRAPHHRGASCGNGNCGCGSGPEPNVLLGAMVGGPGINDDYSDRCDDYVHNVATDYNAGFTSACAALLHLRLTKQIA